MNWQDLSDLARHMWPAWLMIVFLGIVFYAFRPRNKQMFEDCARIPLRSDDDSISGEFLGHD